MSLWDIVLAAPEVSLEEMLEARENRVRRQRLALSECASPLVCLTLNIPGSRKAHRLAGEAFALARDALIGHLERARIPVLRIEEYSEKTGFEGFYSVDADAARLKAMTVNLEETHTLGRLFDMDVLAVDGTTLRGADAGRGERICLVCGGPVWTCARNRTHPAEQLALRAAGLIAEHIEGAYADQIASQATRALLYEVNATPKPGLVDRANCGAHADMDIFTFIDSASVLTPYFREMVLRGLGFEQGAETLLAAVRLPGMWAEDGMLAATGGVNTHKGLVFSLGILCAAIGYLRKRAIPLSEKALLGTCAAIAAETPMELESLAEGCTVTNGRNVHAKFGLTGVRGEAAAGFPNVRLHGLPTLRKMLDKGLSLNDAGVIALLHLMANVEDTNVVSRSGMIQLAELQNELRAFLSRTWQPDEALRFAGDLDARLIRNNISPGGSADLLALSYFLHFIL